VNWTIQKLAISVLIPLSGIKVCERERERKRIFVIHIFDKEFMTNP
jgi:hypothetical protein